MTETSPSMPQDPGGNYIDDQTLLAAIQDEVRAAGEDQQARAANRSTAIDYFYGDKPAAPVTDEDEQDRSDIVSTDVADAVEAVLAEIMPAFSGKSILAFEPVSEEDEQQATLETRAVAHTIAANGGYMAINAGCKDALLRRAGVIKVFWEETTNVEYERHDNVPEQQLPQLLQPRGNEQVEVVDGEVDQVLGTVSGTIRRYCTSSHPRVEAVPLDEFLISGNVVTSTIEECRFLAHQRPVTRSDLVAMGFDKERVDALPAFTSSDYRHGADTRARTWKDNELRSGHESTDFIMACESYYMIDRDGDGIAERRRIVTLGGTEGTDHLFLDEPWSQQPFCVGIAYLGIFSWDGVSLFDKLKSIQDVKTSQLRGLVDGTERNISQRVGAVEGDANVDDLLTSVLGGVVRCKTPNGVFALPDINIHPDLVINSLQYMDEVRRDKGGGAIDTAAQANALAGDTAHGLERMMSAAEQINAMVAKNLAETMIVPLYRKMHYLMRKYMQDPKTVPGSAGWQYTVPCEWSPRSNIVLSMGMSVGERTRRTAALQAIRVIQNEDAEKGLDGILVDPAGMYQTRLDLTQMAGLPNPEQYWVDPTSQQAQQAQQQKQASAQEQQMQAQQMQEQQAQFQYKLMTDIEQIRNQGKTQLETMRSEIKVLEANLQHVAKMFGERVNLVKVEAELDQAEAEREVNKLQTVPR